MTIHQKMPKGAPDQTFQGEKDTANSFDFGMSFFKRLCLSHLKCLINVKVFDLRTGFVCFSLYCYFSCSTDIVFDVIVGSKRQPRPATARSRREATPSRPRRGMRPLSRGHRCISGPLSTQHSSKTSGLLPHAPHMFLAKSNAYVQAAEDQLPADQNSVELRFNMGVAHSGLANCIKEMETRNW